MKVAFLTVGPVAENTFIAISDDGEALLIDPGDEPDKISEAIAGSEANIKAILITHTHFDHVGAVAEMARRSGAEVWVPKLERMILADINSYMNYPGLGPFESYEAEHTVEGGEHLQLAGFEIDVYATPGHSPGHVSYSLPAHNVLFSGDVLFEDSVGRTDLPGSDTQTLLDSIAMLIDKLPPETTVFPGHMGATTLERERLSNPFLGQMR